MKLREKQSLFTVLIADLIQHARALGYDLTFGEAYRPPETAALYAKQRKGIAASLHTLRLAVDFNLFKDGHYLTSTEAHRPLGEYWELQSGDDYECCWGGRFRDGGHYSIAHGRRK